MTIFLAWERESVGRDGYNHGQLRISGSDQMSEEPFLSARLGELDIAARLDSFRLLKTGWCEGRGEAPLTEGLDWLSQAFEQYYPDDIPLPHLYPTHEGGVQAEWSLDTTEASLEIDLKTHKGWWHVLNIETDADTRDLDLDDEEGWQWLTEELRRLSGDAN